MKAPTTTLVISEPNKERGKAPGSSGAVMRSLPAALTLATGILLFSPVPVVERLGLAGLLRLRRDLVGAVCVMALSVLVVAQLLPLGFWTLVGTLRRRAEFRRVTRRLRDLSRSERNLLNQFLARDRPMLILDVKSGATRALLGEGIIDRAAELDESETSLAFTLRPWVREYLRVNVELVENERTMGSARVTDIRSGQPIT
jgi:Super-infection exclusion protein B